MPPYDIQKLRQQQIFNPVDDITGGGTYQAFDNGVDYGDGGYNSDYGQDYSIPDNAPSSMPEHMPSYGQTTPPPSSNSLQDTIDAINRVYTPSTVSKDRLNNLMDNAPTRQPPSFMRALIAGGLSLKAADPTATAEKVEYAPYYRELQDWKEKADPFYKSADLENRENINERTLAGNVVTSQTASDRIASQERIAAEKARINEIRAKAYDFKQHGYTIKVLGDEVVGFSPDGKRVSLGSSGGMDEAAKIALEGEWKVKAAEAGGEAALKRMVIGGAEYYQDAQGNLIRVNPRDATSTPVRPPGSSGILTKPGTPRNEPPVNQLQIRRQRSDALKDAYQFDKDNRKFVKKNNDGTYDFQDRPVAHPASGTWPFNNVEEVKPEEVTKYDEFRKSIDPNYVPPPAGGVGGSAGSGKEDPKKSSGLAPSYDMLGKNETAADVEENTAKGTTSVIPSMGTGPGGYTPPMKKFGPPTQYPNQDATMKLPTPKNAAEASLQQKAITMLSKNGKPITAANVQYLIDTGRVR